MKVTPPIRGADVWDGGESHGASFNHEDMHKGTAVAKILDSDRANRMRLNAPAPKMLRQTGRNEPPQSRVLYQPRGGRYFLCDSLEDLKGLVRAPAGLEAHEKTSREKVLPLLGAPRLLSIDLRAWRLACLHLLAKNTPLIFPSQEDRDGNGGVYSFGDTEGRKVLGHVDGNLRALGLIDENRELTKKGKFVRWMYNKTSVEGGSLLHDMGVFGGGHFPRKEGAKWTALFWGVEGMEDASRAAELFGGQSSKHLGCPRLLSLLRGCREDGGRETDWPFNCRLSDPEALGDLLRDCAVGRSEALYGTGPAPTQENLKEASRDSRVNEVFLEAFGSSGVLVRLEGVEAQVMNGAKLFKVMDEASRKLYDDGSDFGSVRSVVVRNFPHRLCRPARGQGRLPLSMAHLTTLRGKRVDVDRDSCIRLLGRAFGPAEDMDVVALNIHQHQNDQPPKASFLMAFPSTRPYWRELSAEVPPEEDDEKPAGKAGKEEKPGGKAGRKEELLPWIERKAVREVTTEVEIRLCEPCPVSDRSRSDLTVLLGLLNEHKEEGLCAEMVVPEGQREPRFLVLRVPSISFLFSIPDPQHSDSFRRTLGGIIFREKFAVVDSITYSRIRQQQQQQEPTVRVFRSVSPSKLRNKALDHESMLRDAPLMQMMFRQPPEFIASRVLCMAVALRLERVEESKKRSLLNPGSAAGALWAFRDRNERDVLNRLPERLKKAFRGSESFRARMRLLGCPSQPGDRRFPDHPFERQALGQAFSSKMEEEESLLALWGQPLERTGLSVERDGSRVVVVDKTGKRLQVEVYAYCPLVREGCPLRDQDALLLAMGAGEVNRPQGHVFVDHETHLLAVVKLPDELWSPEVEGLRAVLQGGGGEVRRKGGGYRCCLGRKCGMILGPSVESLVLSKLQGGGIEHELCWVCGGVAD
uniref:Uncharacterized protein n=1 Tax=Chromera velia CCMP2878 TaxID=1169474 RepID=A0A0G4FU33_9ALVE|eukprot:Cvel_18676.t1-p1 / transcript=Cvel_18676.t1 / gene=Cvel_18676 / organism=Chromera_velia_CCMP2878 / gene_product=hypothetical protein / transcript_product=hypothetical protein / location=Cvel_scaffold1562:26313-30720(-) / protein_length=922 / sequence_SO=supercontig / SO=protein_coding / is_pseudo=false